MALILTYHNGTVVSIHSVESLRIVRADVIEVKTFGNEPVLHRAVANFQLANYW